VAKIIYGERIGKLGEITLGCSAAIFAPTRQKVLLTRRTDNGRWCFPGGRMDAGEDVTEACVREVLEETGLHVRIERLIGVYSNPHFIIEYADGERCHSVALHFEATSIAGTLSISEETTEYGYYSLNEIVSMDVMEHHLERIKDTFTSQTSAFIR
jgi:ADP-ribose pyrophosphatase YjhB (NUDIX family)